MPEAANFSFSLLSDGFIAQTHIVWIEVPLT